MAVASDSVVKWLMRGDLAIRWQVRRDLLGEAGDGVDRERERVARAGWGRRLLGLQDKNGQWGGGLYTPKWTSTTYTLLLLRALGLATGMVLAIASRFVPDDSRFDRLAGYLLDEQSMNRRKAGWPAGLARHEGERRSSSSGTVCSALIGPERSSRPR